MKQWIISLAMAAGLVVANADAQWANRVKPITAPSDSFLTAIGSDGVPASSTVLSRLPAFSGGDCTTSAGSVALNCTKTNGSLLVNALVPRVSTNAALTALASTYAGSIVRDGYYAAGDSPAVLYTASGSACSLNAGAGDGGSQVQSSDGKCWIAAFGSEIDARAFGVLTSAIDNVAPLVKAINAAALAKTRLVLPPGTINLASASLAAISGIALPSNTSIIGAGARATKLLVTGSTAANLFTATNVSHVRVTNVYAVGNGIDGGFGDGAFINVSLHKETASADMEDIFVTDSTLENFTTARWISFIHYGLNSTTNDSTYKMRRVGVLRNNYVSVSGNNPNPQSLGQTRSFVEFNGFHGPIRDAVQDDYTMDGYYVKQGLGVFSDVADSSFSIQRISNVGQSAATDDVGAYAVTHYAGFATPTRNRFKIGTIENPWSIGVYDASGRDALFEVNECYGQRDTVTATLGKGCIVESDGYDNNYRFGRIYNSEYGAYISGFNPSNSDPASIRHVFVDARIDNVTEAVTVVGGGGSSWGGGVTLTGEIDSLGRASSNGLTLLGAGAGISDVDFNMRTTVTGKAITIGPSGSPVIKDTIIRKNIYHGDGYALFAGSGLNWDNVSIYGDFMGQTSASAVQITDGRKFKIDARIINQASGYAAYLEGCRGTLKIEYVNSPNTIYPSANALGAAIPSWSGNQNDFVQNLNPAELGSAGSKYVVTGWLNVTGGTAWRDVRTLTGN